VSSYPLCPGVKFSYIHKSEHGDVVDYQLLQKQVIAAIEQNGKTSLLEENEYDLDKFFGETINKYFLT
jgi:hypothetical protein